MDKRYIVLHHSATVDGKAIRDFVAIKKEHMARGYRDIGYHWVIENINGILTAIPGRPEWEIGAHCPGRNQDGIGICVVGNFELEVPGNDLYCFVANKCSDIMARHPIREIGGHRDYIATACPGKHFDVEVVRQLVKGEKNRMEWKQKIMKEAAAAGLIDPSYNHQPDQAANKWFVLAVVLNLLEKQKGGKQHE